MAEFDVYPEPDEILGVLLGYIGAGDAFVIGDGGTFTAENDGILYLQVNDDAERIDNSGAFAVTIEVIDE